MDLRVELRNTFLSDFNDLLKTDGLFLMQCDNSAGSWNPINLMGV